jgi:hypothetical protein
VSQHAEEKLEPTRVPLGAFVDRSQRDELAAIAHRDDRSVSSIVRLALKMIAAADALPTRPFAFREKTVGTKAWSKRRRLARDSVAFAQ